MADSKRCRVCSTTGTPWPTPRRPAQSEANPPARTHAASSRVCLAVLTASLSGGSVLASGDDGAASASAGVGAGAGATAIISSAGSSQLRPMNIDRPDTTESPFTVDAGHVQIEASLAEYSFDNRSADDSKRRTFTAAPLLLKVGLADNFDVQLGVNPYTREREVSKTTGAERVAEGFGDLTLRGKLNLWGNDGGPTAFALLPFVKLPTARAELGNEKVEGGIALPLAIELGGDVSLGLMQELDVVRSTDNDRYTLDWLQTATVDFPITEDFRGYVEFAGTANFNRDQKYRAYFNFGLLYAVSADVQLDAGVRLGLRRAAEDCALFVGISYRF